jgi:hypothetical protein
MEYVSSRRVVFGSPHVIRLELCGEVICDTVGFSWENNLNLEMTTGRSASRTDECNGGTCYVSPRSGQFTFLDSDESFSQISAVF